MIHVICATDKLNSLAVHVPRRGVTEPGGILEEAGLRVWAGMRVVVVGAHVERHGVLLHHALRNIGRALYFYSTDTRPRPHLPDAENVTVKPANTTQDSPSPSSIETLLREANSRLTVYKRCLYCNASKAGVQDLYSGLLKEVTKAEARQWAVALSSDGDDQHDLRGHLVRVVGLRYDPYTRYNLSPLGPQHPVEPLTSIDFSILNSVSLGLNLTYEARPPKEPQFGLPLSNGTWSGTVGILQREEADFSLVLSPTPGRMKVIEYSRIYLSESLCILSPRPHAVPQYLQLIKPLSGWVWVITAAIIVCWGVALWVFREVWALDEGREGAWQILPRPPVQLGNTAGGRALASTTPHFRQGVLYGGWLVFGLVLGTAYRSSLIAHLTVITKLPPINTFEDLLARDAWSWGMKNDTGTMILYFTTATDPTRKEVRRRMKIHKLEEGMKHLMEGGYSVIEDIFVAQVTVSSRYTYESGYTPVHFSTSNYPTFAGLAWGFRKGAPFRRAVSLRKQRVMEAGLIDYWTHEAVRATTEDMIREAGGRRSVQASAQQDTEGGGPVVLSLQHLQGIFYLLGLGLLAAIATFARELLQARPRPRPCRRLC
ncbi:hypothetical protein O3P69_012137 [Scylla paramamosain]|uniref:Ionotropic glutamate receptor C-terminal domain-containing protein n=1 Tax=Scylla paramamosain TaxID=85552 RepID=A0AAW0TCV4_SCYPA